MKGKRMQTREDKRKMQMDKRVHENNTHKSSSPKKKNSRMKYFWRRVLVLFILLVIISIGVVAGMGVWFVKDKLGKINYVDIDESQIAVNEGIDLSKTGYRTIVLYGVDSRYNDIETETRSDCIILATIDQKSKEVKLTSVYRDTYLQLTDRGLDKINHAYFYGGAELSLSTINTNLDLDVTEFVTVNFDAVIDIVDAVGGIEMEITSDEVKYINGYISEINQVRKHNSKKITKAGTYTLDGVQALSYGRIRYTEGGDYKRTERMRDIIIAVFDKAKTMNVGQLNKAADKILGEVYTNISSNEIVSLIPQIATYKITDSSGWPYKTEGATIDGVWYGPPVTLESNVKQLHEKVYGQTDYEVSEKVKEISQKIIKKTGLK